MPNANEVSFVNTRGETAVNDNLLLFFNLRVQSGQHFLHNFGSLYGLPARTAGR